MFWGIDAFDCYGVGKSIIANVVHKSIVLSRNILSAKTSKFKQAAYNIAMQKSSSGILTNGFLTDPFNDMQTGLCFPVAGFVFSHRRVCIFPWFLFSLVSVFPGLCFH